MSDALHIHRQFAAMLHSAGVPCPGPRDGLVLNVILGGVDEALRQDGLTPGQRDSLKAYYDALLEQSAPSCSAGVGS